jgi:dienelactone hydrolase
MKFSSTATALALPLITAALLSPAAKAQAPAANAQPVRVPTIEQLAQFPRMTGFTLSPDGQHLAAIESQGDTRNVLVWKTADMASRPTVIGASNMQIQAVDFVKNDMLQVRMNQPLDLRIGGTLTKTFVNKLLITDLEGKTWKEPLQSSGINRSETDQLVREVSAPVVRSRMLKDPDHIVVEGADIGARDLFRYNVRTGVATRLMRLSEDDDQVVVDSQGRPRAKRRIGFQGSDIFVATDIRNLETGAWEEHFRTLVKDREDTIVLGAGSKPGTMIVRSNRGRERAALYEYDVARRQLSEPIFEHRFFEALRPLRMAGDKGDDDEAFDGFRYEGPFGNDVHWLNPEFESLIKGLAQALGIKQVEQTLVDPATGARATTQVLDGVDITIVARHAPKDQPATHVFRVSGANYPPEFYMLRGQRLTLLARAHPELDRRALGSTRLVYYAARDGMQIPAYLTMPHPQLCGPGPYSAVVHPHGGPWARDTQDFDFSGWLPLMVSRCHVVLQPQFRGSDGWGRTLWKAGDAEWGQKMQDDKDDGAQWLAAQKLVDPARVAMFGYSYGGYSAMAAAVRPNGLYKCAIAGAGVSDIEKIWANFYTNPYFRAAQEPTVRGLSPAKQADKIKIPIMVFHGDRDTIVPLIQSDDFVKKARSSGQPVEFHVQVDTSHGPVWRRSEKTRELRLIADYLAKGCGGSGL